MFWIAVVSAVAFGRLLNTATWPVEPSGTICVVPAAGAAAEDAVEVWSAVELWGAVDFSGEVELWGIVFCATDAGGPLAAGVGAAEELDAPGAAAEPLG